LSTSDRRIEAPDPREITPKGCPFCGCPMRIDRTNGHFHHPHVRTCILSGLQSNDVRDWNRRVQLDPVAEDMVFLLVDGERVGCVMPGKSKPFVDRMFGFGGAHEIAIEHQTIDQAIGARLEHTPTTLREDMRDFLETVESLLIGSPYADRAKALLDALATG